MCPLLRDRDQLGQPPRRAVRHPACRPDGDVRHLAVVDVRDGDPVLDRGPGELPSPRRPGTASSQQRFTDCLCSAWRSVSPLCARGRPVAGCFTPPPGPPGSCFRSPFRCRDGRDLGGDRCGVRERDGRDGRLGGTRRSPPLLRRALARRRSVSGRSPGRAACARLSETARPARRSPHLTSFTAPVLTFAGVLVPVLCRAAPAGPPEPAAIQDFAGGSESLNVRASSSRLSGSATSRGSDLSASIVRRNCWR